MGFRDESDGANCAGYSVLELMIAFSIIAIVAGMAIPGLSATQKAAYEASAISYMRTWPAAQELYKIQFGSYADADGQLVIEEIVGNPDPDRFGYTFSFDNPSGQTANWWGRAWPNEPGVSGDRYFYIDISGVIRYSTSGRANANSTPLGMPEGGGEEVE